MFYFFHPQYSTLRSDILHMMNEKQKSQQLKYMRWQHDKITNKMQGFLQGTVANHLWHLYWLLIILKGRA